MPRKEKILFGGNGMRNKHRTVQTLLPKGARAPVFVQRQLPVRLALVAGPFKPAVRAYSYFAFLLKRSAAFDPSFFSYESLADPYSVSAAFRAAAGGPILPARAPRQPRKSLKNRCTSPPALTRQEVQRASSFFALFRQRRCAPSFGYAYRIAHFASSVTCRRQFLRAEQGKYAFSARKAREGRISSRGSTCGGCPRRNYIRGTGTDYFLSERSRANPRHEKIGAAKAEIRVHSALPISFSFFQRRMRKVSSGCSAAVNRAICASISSSS